MWSTNAMLSTGWSERDKMHLTPSSCSKISKRYKGNMLLIGIVLSGNS